MKIILFPGSFDPITKGHKNLVDRTLKIFDKVVIAIGVNSSKHTMFALDKRLQWLKQTFEGYNNVEISTFDNLTVDYCEQIGADFILRGLRNTNDFVYENNIALINKELNKEIETIFLTCDKEFSIISSSMIKEFLLYNKDIKMFIPDNVTISKNDMLIK